MPNMDKYVKQISKDIPEDLKERDDRWLIRPLEKPILDNPKNPNEQDKPNHIYAPNAEVALKKFKELQSMKFRKMPGNRQWRGEHGMPY